MRYAVLTEMAHGWENCWHDGEALLTFANEAEANAEIADHVAEYQRMIGPIPPGIYKVVPVGHVVSREGKRWVLENWPADGTRPARLGTYSTRKAASFVAAIMGGRNG